MASGVIAMIIGRMYISGGSMHVSNFRGYTKVIQAFPVPEFVQLNGLLIISQE